MTTMTTTVLSMCLRDRRRRTIKNCCNYSVWALRASWILLSIWTPGRQLLSSTSIWRMIIACWLRICTISIGNWTMFISRRSKHGWMCSSKFSRIPTNNRRQQWSNERLIWRMPFRCVWEWSTTIISHPNEAQSHQNQVCLSLSGTAGEVNVVLLVPKTKVTSIPRSSPSESVSFSSLSLRIYIESECIFRRLLLRRWPKMKLTFSSMEIPIVSNVLSSNPMFKTPLCVPSKATTCLR